MFADDPPDHTRTLDRTETVHQINPRQIRRPTKHCRQRTAGETPRRRPDDLKPSMQFGGRVNQIHRDPIIRADAVASYHIDVRRVATVKQETATILPVRESGGQRGYDTIKVEYEHRPVVKVLAHQRGRVPYQPCL